MNPSYDDNHAQINLLNEKIDQENEYSRRSRSFDPIKIALISFTTCMFIVSLSVIIWHLTTKDSNNTVYYNFRKDNPLMERYQQNQSSEDIIAEQFISGPDPQIYNEINVSSIIAQMIERKLKSLQNFNTTSITDEPILQTTTPKAIDYLLVSIVINRATVPDMDGTTETDTFIKLFVDNRFVGKTPTHKNSLTPEWNYQIVHQTKMSPENELEFQLWDSDKRAIFGKDFEFIGKISVKLEELMSSDSNGKVVERDYLKGKVWFTVTWDEVYKH